MTELANHPPFEPSLDEALQDPVVLAVLRRDRLSVAEVRRLMEAARARLTGSAGSEAEPAMAIAVEPAGA